MNHTTRSRIGVLIQGAPERRVLFSPTPGYSLTFKGGTDELDLTDGRLTQRPDQHMWFESLAVGWSYAGRVNLALDLGATARIDEIAVRFLGGSPQHGISFPGWVEALVSDEGVHYRRVTEFSRWCAGDFARFGVPDDAGTFPGEAFRWALLECFLNGARGLYFWSGRVWDAESLAAYAEVIRALAPVENVVVDGILAGTAISVDPPGRVSGLKHGQELVLLAADYAGRATGPLQLNIQLPAPSAVFDLFTGRKVAEQGQAGRLRLPLPLTGVRARRLHVKPLVLTADRP